MTDEEREAWEYDGDLAGTTEPSKYEQQLQAAAQRLQAVLPIGTVKAVGLMEVASGIKWLIAENAALKAALAKARVYAVNRQKEHPIGLRDFAAECGVSPTQMSVWTSGNPSGAPLGPPDIMCRR